MTDALVIAHAVASLYMLGLTWFVDRVHYPMMVRYPAEGFQAIEREHMRRTGPVTAPVMLVELATGLMLPWLGPSGVGQGLAWGLALSALAAFGYTMAVFVPLHRRLSLGFDAQVHRRLCRHHTARSLLWTVRAVLVMCLLWQWGTAGV